MSDAAQNPKVLLERIESLLQTASYDQLSIELANARPSDIAEVIEVIDEISRQLIFSSLDAKDAGEVLDKVDDATLGEVIEDLTNEKITDIVATMPPDEAADVVAELDDLQTEEVLEHIADEESDQIEALLKYGEDTAGGIMTSDLVQVKMSETISGAITQIRNADPDDAYFHVFVVDDGGKLKGTVGLITLIRNNPDTMVSDVLEEDIPAVDVSADQEEIANTFRKYDLMVMPVVDKAGCLLGRITIDDVVDVMEEEAEEDVLLMAGTHPNELDTHKAYEVAKVRLPWLMTCLIGSMVSSLILLYFRDSFSSIAEFTTVMVFIPAIAAMGGNSGLQTATIVVRGLATGDLAGMEIGQIYIRESRVALIVALICGLVSGCLVSIILSMHTNGHSENLHVGLMGLSVASSMFIAIMLATSLGILLPFMFKRIGVDPAISSGPLVTTANDIVSNLTYILLTLCLFRQFLS
jgi:magnesium transporter